MFDNIDNTSLQYGNTRTQKRFGAKILPRTRGKFCIETIYRPQNFGKSMNEERDLRTEKEIKTT